MPIDLYYMPLSPPSRACLLVARQLELEVNLKPLNLMKGEQMEPKFLALNPEHTVPTIKDGDLVLWESRAITAYLVNKYSKGDWLYPEDPVQRAKVDRALMFDMGTLTTRFLQYVLPVIFQDQKPDPKALKALQEALVLLNRVLGDNTYAAGATITIADHSLVAVVETIRQCKINFATLSNIKSWLERCKENMPGYDENEQGAQQFAKAIMDGFAKFNAKPGGNSKFEPHKQ